MESLLSGKIEVAMPKSGSIDAAILKSWPLGKILLMLTVGGGWVLSVGKGLFKLVILALYSLASNSAAMLETVSIKIVMLKSWPSTRTRMMLRV